MSGHIRNEDVLDSTLKKGKMDFTEIGNDKILILNHTGQLTSATLSGLTLNTSGVLSVDSTTPYISSVSDPLHVTTGNLTIDGETVEEAVPPMFISSGTLTVNLHTNMAIKGGSQLAADVPLSQKFIGTDSDYNFTGSTIELSDLPTIALNKLETDPHDGYVITMVSGTPDWAAVSGGGGGDFLADGSVPMTGTLISKSMEVDGDILPHTDNTRVLGSGSFWWASAHIHGITATDVTTGDLICSTIEINGINFTGNGSFSGSPEGEYDAPKGSIYIDQDDAKIFIKTTDSGSATGWKELIQAP